MAITFRDRREAGRLLASKLSSYAGRPDVVVLGLPRGGVPVAFEVAKILKVPLDVFVVRKLGVPGDDELAMGATATGKVRVLNEDVIKRLAIPDEVIESVATGEERELARRERQYRENRTPVAVNGKTVILVDDGLATGATMRAAVLALKVAETRRISLSLFPLPHPKLARTSRMKSTRSCALPPLSRFMQLVNGIKNSHKQAMKRCANFLAEVPKTKL